MFKALNIINKLKKMKKKIQYGSAYKINKNIFISKGI